MMNLIITAKSCDQEMLVRKCHAHEEEEHKLFPRLSKELTGDERAALGNGVLAMFESLMEGEPRLHLPKEVSEAARLPSA